VCERGDATASAYAGFFANDHPDLGRSICDMTQTPYHPFADIAGKVLFARTSAHARVWGGTHY